MCCERSRTLWIKLRAPTWSKPKVRLHLWPCKVRQLIRLYLGFNCTDEENTSSLATLRKRAWLALRAKIDEQTADPVILGKLRGHFEERFRYDEHGVPRVWKPADDIDGAFKKAKDEVCFSKPLGVTG